MRNIFRSRYEQNWRFEFDSNVSMIAKILSILKKKNKRMFPLKKILV